MTYRNYVLTPVTRHLAGGATEGVEIRGNGRVTWAGSAGIAKRAIDTWEQAKAKTVDKVGGQAKTGE